MKHLFLYDRVEWFFLHCQDQLKDKKKQCLLTFDLKITKN